MMRLQEKQQAFGNMHIISFARKPESFNVQEIGQDLRVDLKDRHCDCGDFQTDRYLIMWLRVAPIRASTRWFTSIQFIVWTTFAECTNGSSRSWASIAHGHHIMAQGFIQILELKRIMKGRPKSTCFLNEIEMHEMRGQKNCGLYRSEGHNRRQYPHRVGQSSNWWVLQVFLICLFNVSWTCNH